MKKSRFLSSVLAVMVAVSVLFSFAIVSQAATEDNKAVISFSAVQAGTTWNVNLGLKIKGGLHADDSAEVGTGVVALQLGFNDVVRTKIKKIVVKSANMTLGTLADGTGLTASWSKITGDESVYGDTADGTVYGEEEPYTIASIQTKYTVAAYSADDIVKMFNNVNKTVLKIATFDVMYDNLTSDYFTTYAVAEDGINKTADADYVLGTPKNAVTPDPGPSVKTITPAATTNLTTDEFAGGTKTDVQIGSAVGMKFTQPENVTFTKMIWAITTDAGKKYSKAVALDLSDVTGEVALGATFINGSHANADMGIVDEVAPLTITAVNAIFTDGTDNYFTDAADEANQK